MLFSILNRQEKVMKFSAKKIRGLRENRGWSQEHLGEVSGVSYRTIQRMEKDGNASPETIMAVSSAFSVSPDELQSEYNEKIGDGKFKAGGALGAIFLFCAVLAYLSISGSPSIMVDIPSLLFVISVPIGLSLLSNGAQQTLNTYSLIGWLFYEQKEKTDIQLSLPVLRKLIHYSYVAAGTGALISLLGMMSPADQENIRFNAGISVALIMLSYASIQAELLFRPLYHKLNRLLLEQKKTN
jgi:transcriptional regulator with XRE-family HTH domain